MCPRLPLLVLALLTSDLGLTLGEFPSSITIGAALSAQKHCDKFAEYLEAVNVDEESLPEGVRLNASCVVMNSNPIVAAEMVCDSLIPNQVYTIIASHSATGDLSPMSVSFTAGFYRIPIIGISARDSAFSDKNVHTAFLRTVAPYSEQADIWVDMLATFGFRLVMFIHSTDQEGRTMLSKFQSKLEKKEVEVKLEQSISYTAGQQNFTSTLQQVGELRSRVVLLFACADDAEKIYAEAERMGMISSDYAWIVTEQALRPANTPVGVLGLKLGQSAEDRHLHDAVAIVAKAIKVMALNDVSISPAPSDCHEENVQWESGPDLLSNLMEQELTAADDSDTGLVKFNDVGDRMYSTYQVFNKRPAQSKIADKFVGVYSKDQKLVLNQDAIIWPGNTSQKPKGIQISTHLKVVTIPATPFVYSNVMIGDKCDPGQVHCPRYNETEGTSTDFCCHGYCVDLMNKLSMEVNFTFELHLSGQGQYGSLERRNGNPKKTWNGMIGELVKAESDMIVAPLTINPERALDIDFTKPFKYQGMTILVKKTTKDSSLASFLQPFQDTLWILVGLSVHVVALVLYLLDRFSPFGRFKLAKSDDTEEDALNLSGAVWFAWGVLLNSGIGEGTPRSFSARVLGMVWAGFAMIIVASYTANLAAFLVLDRPEAAISGIDDARLRNPQDTFQYATVQDSAVAMYFKRQVELSTMYRTMEKHFYDNEKEAIQDVKNNKLHAFIWDSSRLEYEAAKDCDLVTAGELFGRSGYGIGLTKGSPWTEEISLKILSFHENGFMERLDNSWILVRDTKCPERDASPATLGLTNMAGVFMMVAGGIMAGVFLIFIEIAYKKHRGLKEKELELAKTAADRWRGNIEKRKLLRQTRAALKNEYLLGEKPNGKSETTYITADASPAAARAQQGQERNNGQPGTYTPLTIQPSRHTSPGRIPARRYQYQV